VLVAIVLDQRHWWDLRDDYLFGYLVPLFVAWVLYERWPLLRETLLGSTANPQLAEHRRWQESLATLRAKQEVPGWVRWGFRLLAGGMALCGFLGLLMAALYRVMEGPNLVTTQLLVLSLIALLFSGAFIFSDRRADGSIVPLRERLAFVGLFLFPACIWLVSAPMFNFLEKAISTLLLQKVAVSVFFVFDVLGFVIVREGNVLVLPQGEVGVEDACSGIRSLMACLFAGSFLAAVCLPVGLRGLWKKVLMVLAAMVFAFITNIGRSLFLTGWAYAHGSESIGEEVRFFGMELGTLHDVTGFAVIAPVVLMLLALVPLFTFQWEREWDEGEGGDSEDAPAESGTSS
jgi:exosortase/archaeosortase family protein